MAAVHQFVKDDYHIIFHLYSIIFMTIKIKKMLKSEKKIKTITQSVLLFTKKTV